MTTTKKPNLKLIKKSAENEKQPPRETEDSQLGREQEHLDQMNLSERMIRDGNKAAAALGIEGISTIHDVNNRLNNLEAKDEMSMEDKTVYDKLADIDSKYGMMNRLIADSNKFFDIEYESKALYSPGMITELVRKLAGKVVSYSGTSAAVAWLEPSGYGEQKQWVFRQYKTMKDLLRNKKISVKIGEKPNGTPKIGIVELFDAWWHHPERDHATGSVFRPDRPQYRTRDGKLNLWSGFVYQPTHGDKHLPILDFVEQNICAGRKDVTEHLLNYCAHMFQKPWDKPWACWVIASEEQGTGKSLFVGGLLGKLLGQHAMTFKSSSEMGARFNVHLRPIIQLYHDESLFTGNKGLSETMKSNISDDRMSFELKGIDKTGMEKIYHRHFISTNAVHAAIVEDTDRRYNVISPVMVPGRDKAWMHSFAEKTLKDPEVMSDWLGYLLSRSVDEEAVKNPIDTEEKQVQRELSLTGPQRFMRDLTGILAGDISFNDVNALETFIERTKELTRVNRNAVKNLYPAYQSQFRIHAAETLSDKGWSKEIRIWASKLAGPDFEDDLKRGGTGYEPKMINGLTVYNVAMFVERESTILDD